MDELRHVPPSYLVTWSLGHAAEGHLARRGAARRTARNSATLLCTTDAHPEWRYVDSDLGLTYLSPRAETTTGYCASAFLSARKSRQASRFCRVLRSRKAGWYVASARISRLPVSNLNQRPRVLVIPSLVCNNVCVEGCPRQTRISGSASSIWRRMKGRQMAVSCGVGVRLPGGRQGTTLAI